MTDPPGAASAWSGDARRWHSRRFGWVVVGRGRRPGVLAALADAAGFVPRMSRVVGRHERPPAVALYQ